MDPVEGDPLRGNTMQMFEEIGRYELEYYMKGMRRA
jgi:hypothetical protein